VHAHGTETEARFGGADFSGDRVHKGPLRVSEVNDSGERHAVDNARRVMNGPVPAVPPRT
jgi:hypothetical protein